jgi:CMP-N,N'-diacetyllegionaminic acid synthase
MTVCFDIDGVLCDQVEGNYADARPRQAMIDLVNRLYDRGDKIILHTSRFMGRAKNNPPEAERIGREFTEQQLAGWGVRYHELWMGKPRYDYVIDDRSVFYNGDAMQVEAWLEERATTKIAQD